MLSEGVVYAVADIPPFWSYDTHPNFWAAGSHKYTAKKYSLHSATPNPGYEFNWVWSGPYGSNQRDVIYQAYPNDSPGLYLEWERWSGDIGSHRATVYTYGGSSEASSKPRYPSYSSCLAKQTGVDWPNLTAGARFSFSPESHDYQGYCSNHWVNEQNPGGYIAIYLKESYRSGTTERNNMCNKYLPASQSSSANSICKTSPNAGVVEQRYLIPDARNYTHGCEMTIYAWGYPYDSADNYKNWFRNGELRWTDWLNLGWLSSPKSPDDDRWWGVECSRAWSEKPNWVYTGVYKLTATEYFDDGSGPTPTSTPTPKPGDANGDGIVDGLDYIIWLNHYNQSTGNGASDGDFNGNGKVDGLDYVIWLTKYEG